MTARVGSFAVGVTATLAVLAAGCTAKNHTLPGAAGPTTTAVAAVSGPATTIPPGGKVDWSTAEIPADQLKPPVVGNANIRLTQEAARTENFCFGWGRRWSFKEPRQYDLSATISYANAYYYAVHFIDPDAGIPNKSRQPGAPATIELPADVKAGLAAVENDMYAYWARLQFSKQLRQANRITDEQLHHRMDVDFVRLASADYTDAEHLLEKFYTTKC